MKKIPNIYILIFPYILLLYPYIIVILYSIINIVNNTIAPNDPLILENVGYFLMPLGILIMLYVLSYITVVILNLLENDSKKIIKNALLMKIMYIPVHLFLFYGMGKFFEGMRDNPFLVLFALFPYAISRIVLSITGIISTTALINLYKNKIYKLGRTVVYILLSYCYIADLVISIIAYIKVRDYNKDIEEVKEGEG